MTSGDASTRDRLLDAAIALFASQGYAATSVAEIQQACGLSPGSGALYKHFPSKSALLIEATQRQVNRMVAVRDEHDRTRPADTREALRRGAERIWETIDINADLLRVMFREPEAIEDYVDELWSAITLAAYQRMGAALSGAKAAGSSHVDDPEATTAVLLAALAYLPIVQILIKRTPGSVDADRFREAWLRLAGSVFSGAPST
jgi:AcrR family transcriptional regulator